MKMCMKVGQKIRYKKTVESGVSFWGDTFVRSTFGSLLILLLSVTSELKDSPCTLFYQVYHLELEWIGFTFHRWIRDQGLHDLYLSQESENASFAG